MNIENPKSDVLPRFQPLFLEVSEVLQVRASATENEPEASEVLRLPFKMITMYPIKSKKTTISQNEAGPFKHFLKHHAISPSTLPAMRKQTKSSLMPTHACQHCSNVQTVPSCEPPIEKGRSRNFFAVMESWRTWMWPLEWSSRIKFTVRNSKCEHAVWGKNHEHLAIIITTHQAARAFLRRMPRPPRDSLLCISPVPWGTSAPWTPCYGCGADLNARTAHEVTPFAPGDGEWACHRSGLEEMAPKFMISADSIISKLEIFMGDGVAIKECDWRLVSC